MNQVLIVDDSSMARTLIKRSLEICGFENMEISEAPNGKEALDIMKNKPFDLVFTDLNMPVLDGLQASTQILDFLKEKGAEELVIIAITANVDIADQEKCYEAGMKRILTKPVKKKDLEVMLREYLEF